MALGGGKLTPSNGKLKIYVQIIFRKRSTHDLPFNVCQMSTKRSEALNG